MLPRGSSVFLLVPLAFSWGCAQAPRVAGRPSSVGSLTASLSQVEADNQDLQMQLKRLETDLASAEDDLARERVRSRQLDEQLRDTERTVAGRSDPLDADSAETLPAASPGPARRRPPSIQIPGPLESSRSRSASWDAFQAD